jgi:hypothetical protein
MPFRRSISCLAAVVVMSVAACATAGARLAAPPIGDAELIAGDAYMKAHGFEVMKSGQEIAQFGAIRRVYVTGRADKPPILLLHELPGLRDVDIDLGARLGEQFHVFVPLMFGLPRQNDNDLGRAQACGTLFDCESNSAQHKKIRGDLTPVMKAACGTAECGVIGMCLTGSLPLWLIHDANVVALVLAQPSLPFPRHWWSVFHRGIDISEEDTASAMKVAADRRASIFMIRLHGDIISSHRGFEELKHRMMPVKGIRLTCQEDHGEVFEHSSLVRDEHHLQASDARFATLTAFLNARLRDRAPQPGDCK